MENALRACCKGIKLGKILIHGESKTGEKVCREPRKSSNLNCYIYLFVPWKQLQELIYEKLPTDISSRHVLLLDPILASGKSRSKPILKCMYINESNDKWWLMNLFWWKTKWTGNSAIKAITVLLSKGVPESNIIFLNLISVSFNYVVLNFYLLFFIVWTILSMMKLCSLLKEYMQCAKNSQSWK